MAYNGLKMGTFHLFGTPNAPGSFLEKRIFDPFLTHFLVPKNPICQAFRDFQGLKWATKRLKTCQKHLFSHPTGPF